MVFPVQILATKTFWAGLASIAAGIVQLCVDIGVSQAAVPVLIAQGLIAICQRASTLTAKES